MVGFGVGQKSETFENIQKNSGKNTSFLGHIIEPAAKKGSKTQTFKIRKPDQTSGFFDFIEKLCGKKACPVGNH